jgi:hypothetical protein
MGRRPKPAKVRAKAKAPLARKAPTKGAARVHEVEQRLAESLEREKAKDRALTEALEQQTATSEILRVISRSQTTSSRCSTRSWPAPSGCWKQTPGC